MKGYCGIGIYGTKTASNVGTLWRSAGLMGASFIFTIGHRYPKQASDTIKAWKHIPLYQYDSFDEFQVPKECDLIGVEQVVRSKPLPSFVHPERAVYLLGAEDTGLPAEVVGRCRSVVEIPSERCLNVAVAGSIVLYDRRTKA